MRANDIESLTALFRRLGARNPDGWAKSQIQEGIPQLARFLFLREAWTRIVDESDSSWITAAINRAAAAPNAPYSGMGRALKALLSRGASESELTDVVRGMQAALLFDLCYMLEDPDLQGEVKDTCWGLFVVDDDGAPLEPLNGLHESVLETDPTGREMRPKEGAG